MKTSFAARLVLGRDDAGHDMHGRSAGGARIVGGLLERLAEFDFPAGQSAEAEIALLGIAERRVDAEQDDTPIGARPAPRRACRRANAVPSP